MKAARNSMWDRTQIRVVLVDRKQRNRYKSQPPLCYSKGSFVLSSQRKAAEKSANPQGNNFLWAQKGFRVLKKLLKRLLFVLFVFKCIKLYPGEQYQPVYESFTCFLQLHQFSLKYYILYIFKQLEICLNNLNKNVFTNIPYIPLYRSLHSLFIFIGK